MSKVIAIGAGLLLLILLLLFTTTFSVSFHEVAVTTRFGQAGDDPVVDEPGLHFKLPFFIDQVEKFDTRMQLVESPLQTVPIADRQQILLRAFLLWEVDRAGDGPLAFYRAYRDVASATVKLDDSLSNAFGVLGSYQFDDLIGPSSRLEEAEGRMLAEIEASLRSDGKPSGIRPLRVGISKIGLPPATTQAVLLRMQVTRRTLADSERQRGSAESESIRADANTKADKLRAFSERAAAEIRKEGDLASARYLQRMSADPEFAILLTWLRAMEESLGPYTTFILPADMAPFTYMDLSRQPMPTAAEAVPDASTDDDGAAAPSDGTGG